MAFKIGFAADTGEKKPVAATYTVPQQATAPRKSVVQIYFAGTLLLLTFTSILLRLVTLSQQKLLICLTNEEFLYPSRRYGSLVYHQPVGLYIIAALVLRISSRQRRVFSPSAWWYAKLRFDDIQFLRNWWYTTAAPLIYYSCPKMSPRRSLDLNYPRSLKGFFFLSSLLIFDDFCGRIVRKRIKRPVFGSFDL